MNIKELETAKKIIAKWAIDEKIIDGPAWYSDADLPSLTRKFQHEFDLVADGVIGPMTFSRLVTWDMAQTPSNYEIELIGPQFRVHQDFHNRCASPPIRKKNLTKIVTHWDAALNADSCISILLKRKVSTHFIIDNDGTIIQLLPVSLIAYHASGNNSDSIGIDLSNAYYLKYSDWYKKHVGVDRPVLTSSVHGRTSTHLGYYPAQIASYKRLCDHLCTKYGIQRKVPLNQKGELITTTFKGASNFNGIMCHYHLTEDKIDCQGLDLKNIFSN
jgi:hypothetical protein